MKYPFNAGAPSFDAKAVNETIQRALASAGLDTTSGSMRGVTETIRRALAAGRVAEAGPRFDRESLVDVEARVLPAVEDSGAVPDRKPSIKEAQQQPGSFELHEFSNGAEKRTYKVYVPAMNSDAPCAMIVMLHGCTQSADDFAAGTQMNRLADAHGFLVVYPEQATHANASKCWNWFKPTDQLRGAGEPSLISGIVREVAQRHGADLDRIFVAGLSAGATMAVVLGETYPELFAGVGAHSGLPCGSAQDMTSALAAMKGGRSGTPGLKGGPCGADGACKRAVQAVPVIVFHGDRDHIVQQTNGESIVLQAQEAHVCPMDGLEAGAWLKRVKVAFGRYWTVEFSGWRKAQSLAYLPDARMVALSMIIESLVIDPDVWKAWFAKRAPFNVFLDQFGRAWLRMPLPSGNSRVYPLSRGLAELAAGLDEAELGSLKPEHLAATVNKLAGKAQAAAAVATFGQLLNRIQSAMAPDVPGLVLGYADGSLASVSVEEMCLERQDGAGPTMASVKAWHEHRARPEKSETRTAVSSMRAGKNGAMAGVSDFRKAMSEALALLEDRRGQKAKKEAGTQEGQGSESPSKLGPINRFKVRIEERWDDLVASPALPPMCSRLASWMHTLADLGQAGGDPYAPKTLKNYWYSWGLRLLEEMEDMDPRDLSPEEFEELYLQVVEDAEVVNRQHLYPPLRNLHRYLVAEHGVCDIDWTDLRVATDQGLSRIDANLVQHAEYLRALELLRDDKEVSERIAALQSTALVLLYRCGMRINEVLGLRDSDIYRHDGRLQVRVAGNRFRMLKTENSRRTIVILEALEASEEKALASWSGHVKHFASGRDIKRLFAAGTTGEERAELIPRRTIALRIGQALRLATRDPSTRIHHCRHGFGTRLLLAGLDVEPPNVTTDEAAAKARRKFVAMLRDVLTSEPDATRRLIWAVAVMMGHASPAGTTLRTYFHGGHELLKRWHAGGGWHAGKGIDPIEWHAFAAGVKLKTMQRLRQRASGKLTQAVTEEEWSRLRRVGDGARVRKTGRLPAISLEDGTATLVNADKVIDHARRFGRADGLADSLFVAEFWVEKVIRAADEQARKWDVPGAADEFCWFDGANVSYSPHQTQQVEKALATLSGLDAHAMHELSDLLRRRLDPRKNMIAVESVDELDSLSKVVVQLLEQPSNVKVLVPGKSVEPASTLDRGAAGAVPEGDDSAKEAKGKRQKPRRAYEAVEGLEAAEAIADLAREMGFTTEPFGRVVAARSSRHSRTQMGDRAGLTIGQNDSDRLRSAKVFTRVMAIAAVVDAVEAC